AEFLELAAKREQAPGYAFGEDSAWQKEFEDAFEFEETADQLNATAEIKQDMQSDKAMDRLLCGDVGYGKTEVAARAIFKCLEHGKQAVILAPTTLLANQHFHTLSQRLASYPFRVEMLSRFRSEGQQNKIIEKMKTGEIDLLIGTHRILSGDVAFKDLGLLVIDEEQRFGVQHKEVIKKLKETVDVLTLSATPIPRTLHLSLIGVRNMSVIEEPPEGRYPVQTYVMEQDDLLLRDVIRRELGRGGQVYIVYNRVRGIRKIAAQFSEWVPEARIAVGHGQMGERELEDVMIGFVEREYDVLVSTTIIESGLDIPNANTVIIMDADHLGLSQLYQLRGRVGRSNRMAYAYLVYRKDKVLSEIAEKRLRAIREFTEFGAGFHVAMRDLELRGAGNILGTEQSGHMLSIGYEMYCKLVEEVVNELQGKAMPDSGPKADTSIELSIPAYLPETYISDELTRLSVYKRIALIRNRQDRSDMLDELMDRFGDLPKEAENLLDVALIRSMASAQGIGRIVLQHKKLVFLFEAENVLSPEIFAALLDAFGNDLTIFGGVEPRISVLRGKKPAIVQSLDILERMTTALEKEND
ncbi:MAG TPA: transcription-repair coupling factor, partial [Clostridiales bacterium]|nr:transcription-repair coupling factor [Clostridiales bacterium]